MRLCTWSLIDGQVLDLFLRDLNLHTHRVWDNMLAHSQLLTRAMGNGVSLSLQGTPTVGPSSANIQSSYRQSARILRHCSLRLSQSKRLSIRSLIGIRKWYLASSLARLPSQNMMTIQSSALLTCSTVSTLCTRKRNLTPSFGKLTCAGHPKKIRSFSVPPASLRGATLPIIDEQRFVQLDFPSL